MRDAGPRSQPPSDVHAGNPHENDRDAESLFSSTRLRDREECTANSFFTSPPLRARPLRRFSPPGPLESTCVEKPRCRDHSGAITSAICVTSLLEAGRVALGVCRVAEAADESRG